MPSKSTRLKALIILQARIASKRLPGKVVKKLQGIPMLAHSIRRLGMVDNAVLVVATSDLSRDDLVAELANSETVACFRGSEADVLDRFYGAASEYSGRVIIRATGDNPLVDPVEAGRVLDAINTGGYHYVSGFHEVDGWKLPDGVGVEAFTRETLENAWREGTKQKHREHINNYIFDNKEKYRCYDLKCLPQNSYPQLRLTVDTLEDFSFIERVGEELGPLTGLSTSEIIEWWKSNLENCG